MASRNITDFFKPKPKPSEALGSAIEHDIISITTVEREEVRKQLKETKTRRSSYCKYTNTDRAKIGRYAVNHGVASAVRKFKGKFLLPSSNKAYPISNVNTWNCSAKAHLHQ